MTDIAKDILPLKNPAGFNRDINIESCAIDAEHFQIRGQLTDTRNDYQDPTKQFIVHCLVVSITVSIKTNTITEAQFGLPKMAFENMCEKLPAGAELLIGVDVFKGFSFKLRELYGGKRSCFHLSSLLQAMVPAITQCRSWNFDFKRMDAALPVDKVPLAMDTMLSNVKNSCHAWEENNGGITNDFKEGKYERMLDRMAPQLLGRWKQDKTND
ncbi:MAG: DUF2889 domain-containing protein [Pseudomonadales bacterium]|nr:DUF2889 domain-containing protein [Pseudomonadales bacterium]